MKKRNEIMLLINFETIDLLVQVHIPFLYPNHTKILLENLRCIK